MAVAELKAATRDSSAILTHHSVRLTCAPLQSIPTRHCWRYLLTTCTTNLDGRREQRAASLLHQHPSNRRTACRPRAAARSRIRLRHSTDDGREWLRREPIGALVVALTLLCVVCTGPTLRSFAPTTKRIYRVSLDAAHSVVPTRCSRPRHLRRRRGTSEAGPHRQNRCCHPRRSRRPSHRRLRRAPPSLALTRDIPALAPPSHRAAAAAAFVQAARAAWAAIPPRRRVRT